jgi:hypothetical protein
MHHLRLLIIAIATILVLALAAFALISRPPQPDPGDDIIIKGGSLEIQCGNNHGPDCLGTNDNTGKYKHKQSTKHVTKLVVKNSQGVVVFDSTVVPVGQKPEVDITYKTTP